MTDTQLTIILTETPQILAALGTLYLVLRNGHKTDKVARQVEEVHVATNGMKDALVKTAGELGKAEGKAEERVEERDRVDKKILREQS